MSGNLRLNGATSGYSELSAPDVAGDQTFTFPAAGGTLLTGSPEDTGSGGSSGSAQVVGYQQGTWTPTVVFATTAGDPTTTNSGGWTRIGNKVSLWSRITITALGGGEGAIQVSGIPYDVQANFTPNTAIQGYGTVSFINNADNISYFPAATLNVDDNVSFRFVGGNLLTHNNVEVGFTLRFSIDYVTDNTDWTPNAGAAVS